MFRAILVPLDGSAFAEQALPGALHLARRSGASLRVIVVHTPLAFVESGLVFDDRLDRQLRDQEQNYLETILKRLQDGSAVAATGSLREGLVTDAICEEVKAGKLDLIVMTTHGRGPLSRFWLGSVADDLVRRAVVPLLLLRPLETAVDLSRAPDWRHLVIPLDGSVLAEQVLGPATALGQLLDADYTLLRIVQPLLYSGHDPTMLVEPALGQPATEQLQAQASTYLEAVAARLRAQALRVEARVVVHTRPASAILEQSDAAPNALVALATHGRGGLTRALLGSVADKVIRGATMPVLVCRPGPREEPGPREIAAKSA
jgi:nucleotide-binding universal stress UspA family protein